MTPPTTHPPSPVGSLDAADTVMHPPVQEWLDLVESALHGIHHSLNNRIGSLMAVVDLQQTGGIGDVAGGLDGLASEVDRLQECNKVIRLLPDAPAGEEALDLRDVLGDAIAIHEVLPSMKEVSVVMATAAATPVRAERWALMRALTLLLRSAKAGAKAAGPKAASIRVSIDADEHTVRAVFRFDGAEVREGAEVVREPSRYAQILAERFGGATAAGPGAVELRMPTLKSRRAADRR